MPIAIDTPIRNSDELHKKIAELHVRLRDQEKSMKNCVRELHYSFHLTNVLRTAFKNLEGDEEFRANLVEAGLNAGGDVIVDKVIMRRVKGLTGFIIREGVKKVIAHVLSKRKNKVLKKAGF